MLNGTRRQSVVDADHFKIIRQLTLQLPTTALERPERLAEVGWNLDRGEFLYGLASSLPFDVAPGRVRIVVTDGRLDETAELNRNLVSANDDHPWADKTRYAPVDAVAVWVPTLRVTFDNLGPEEAWYRIGFREEDVNDALTALEASL